MAQVDIYERVLLVKPTVYVYKVPPITSASRGFKASDWNLAQPDWTGRLRLISRGDLLFLRIEDSNTGDLYCQAPVLAYPGPQVQQVSDSRRYFVVKVVSDTGRSALIGIGFADGSDSFDLNVALQDFFTTLVNAAKINAEDLDCPKLDLSLKGGIRVNLNIGSSKQSPNDEATAGTSKSTYQEEKSSKAAINALFSDPSKPFILPPPPSASSRRRHFGATRNLNLTSVYFNFGNNKMSKPLDKNFGYGQRKPVKEADFKIFMKDIHTRREEYAFSVEDYNYDERRSRCINGIAAKNKGDYRGICYWMFRDQRVDDNWALICAQKFALEHKCPLYVTFFLMSHYSVAGLRQYEFMLEGLKEVEEQCRSLGIQFHLELGYAKDLIEEYVEVYDIDFVIADFMPLRDPLSWVEEVGKKLKKHNIPLYQVDAHNIIPCWFTSPKQEFAARTIRPKIHKHLKDFLTEYPNVEKHPYEPKVKNESTDWKKAWSSLKIDETVLPVTWAEPGSEAAFRMLYEFITQRLKHYEKDRNNPTKHGLSYMSPYFHFGKISVQRVILSITDKAVKTKAKESVDAYIEEAVVRRELSDNYCLYCPDYDNYDGAPDWAKRSLEKHRKDKREKIYTREELQFAKTHDNLWNAAQIQLLVEGKMHGFLRMYWAKKILEWTPSVEDAIDYAIFLNDKYEIDGRDPNGYVGIMWSMCGLHDRPWFERPVFGQIRYMNYAGCDRKFNIAEYAKYYKTFKPK